MQLKDVYVTQSKKPEVFFFFSLKPLLWDMMENSYMHT